MRARIWFMSLLLVALGIACGDQPTEVVVDREVVAAAGMAGAPGSMADATATSEDGLVISTDKDDYQPGDTVFFSGSGWPANDTLDIVLTDEPLTHDPHQWSVNVDTGGAFHDSTYVVDMGDLDVTFTLVATSRATGRSLSVVFTDAQPQSVTLSPTSNTVSQGGTATYTTTVRMVGNTSPCTITLAVTAGLPSGASATFNNNPIMNQSNINFSRTLTIMTTGATATGTFTFTVQAQRGTNCQGSGAESTTGTLIVQDGTAPTVTINQAGTQADPTNAGPINFTAQFSENVTGFTGTDVSFAGSTVGGAMSAAVTGGPSTYNVAVTGMTGAGAVVVSIPAGAATDGAGNGNTASTSTDNTVTFDATALTVTINQAATQVDPTNASPVHFTVVFNKTATGFTASDVSIAGTASTGIPIVTGPGPTYDVAVPVSTDGTVIATIIPGAAIDAAGNPSVASMSADNEVTYDQTRPTVTINQASAQPDPTNASPINFTVVFSEPVLGFTAGDVTISGTATTSTPVVTGTGPTYNVAVPVTDDGTVIASIAADKANDLAGNGNTASTSTDHTVTYDATPPTVTINQASGQADPTGTSPINFTVIFSESVTGFTGGDVTLSGTAGTSTPSVTGGGTTYNVAVPATSPGTVIASIGAGKAFDAAGNGNAASTSTDHTVTYDPEPPAVSNVAVDPALTNGTIEVTATARVDDAAAGNSTIVAAEYSIDGGPPVAMSAVDGSFDSPTENVRAVIPASVVSALSAGDHQVCVRGTDAAGNTSSFSDTGACVTLRIDPQPPVVSNVEVDPDPTNGTIDVTARATVDDAATGNSKIVAAFYRIDNGPDIAMAASDGGFDEATENVTASIPAATVAALSNGPHTVCVRGTDQAGNSSTYSDAGACTTLTVDKVPPVVSNVTVTPSLTNGSIAVEATARVDDATTGGSRIVAAYYSIDGGTAVQMAATDGSFSSATEDVKATIPASAVNALSEGLHTVCVQGKDLAGNLSSFSASGACATLEIDKTPPEVTINQKAGQPDPTNTSPIHFTVVFTETVSDFATGDVTLSGTAGATTATVTGSGTTYNVAVSGMTADGTVKASLASGVAHDAAGNGNNASTSSDNEVLFDQTPPAISCGTADGNWHADNVSIACTASDSPAGLADPSDASFSLSTTVPAGAETALAATGSRTIQDNAGNSATAGPIGNNKIDRKAPTLSLTCPAGPVLLNAPGAVATWTAADGGSGVTPDEGEEILVVNSIGSKSASKTVQDGVGNSTSASCNYLVTYQFTGFYAPVDRPNTMNVSKAGQAIPLKWTLKDANGLPITNLTSVAVKTVSMNCDGSGPTDPIEEYATVSTSGLLNHGGGNYQYNWKTASNLAGTCKSLSLVFGSGGLDYTEGPHAFFTFKK